MKLGLASPDLGSFLSLRDAAHGHGAAAVGFSHPVETSGGTRLVLVGASSRIFSPASRIITNERIEKIEK